MTISTLFISAETFKYTLGRDAYLVESMNKGTWDETVKMRYSPYFWDYDPYSFKLTYGGKTKIASLNNTRTLSKMADAEYKNRTIDIILSTKGSISTANPRFGISVQSMLCPPKGCPLPPQPSLTTPMRCSKDW